MSLRNTRTLPALAAVAALFALACLAPALASAAFTRPFERQISGVGVPGGVATDSENHVWVGDLHAELLREFEPAAAGNGVSGTPFATGVLPGSVAAQSATAGNGLLYVTAPERKSVVEMYEPNGTHVGSWGSFEKPYLAVDNNPASDVADPSRCAVGGCTVYVSFSNGIEKLSSTGQEEAFVNANDEPTKEPYISGGKITGSANTTNGGCGTAFTFPESHVVPGAVAVDAAGDLFVAVPECESVFEYRASGEYVRAFEMQSPEVPRIGPRQLVGEPVGVAVDPVSGHLIVTLETGAGAGAVDEFDPLSGKFVDTIEAAGETGGLVEPVGVAVDSLGDLYVGDKGPGRVDVWGPGAYFPTVTTGAVSGLTASSVVLSGLVDPAQHGNSEQTLTLKECFFQYVDEAGYEEALAREQSEREKHEPLTGEQGFAEAEQKACTPGAGEIKSEPEVATEVQAGIAGLTSGVTYRYRLVAVSGGAKGGRAPAAALAFTAPHAPEIVPGSVSAGNVTSAFADLRAQIDPLGAATTYHFEYDTRPYVEGEGPHGASVPVPDGSVGAGGPTGGAHEGVVQHVGGLAPGTTYHFRVVAQNEQGASVGQDESFTTQAAVEPVPPDSRAFELLTPPDRQGGGDTFAQAVGGDGEIKNDHDVGTPAESGKGFNFETDSAFGPFPFAFGEDYVFGRHPAQSSWGFESLAAPSLGTQSDYYGAVFDPADLSRVALNDGIGASISEAGLRVSDLVGPPGAASICSGPLSLDAAVATDCYIDLHQDPPVHGAGSEELKGTFEVAGSTDLSHVLLESGYPTLCPGGEGVKHGHVLCEWSGGYETLEDGESKPELKLVNTINGSTPLSECGARIGANGSPEDGDEGTEYRAVSGDGRRVIFTAPDPVERSSEGKGCWDGATLNPPQLYVRTDGSSTLDVSAPEPRVEEAGSPLAHHAPLPYPAWYVGASADGSRVFFATKTWLTADHPATHGLELYECEITETEAGPACILTRITAGEHPESLAELHMVFGVSADGSAVYFSANGVLTPGPEHAGDCAQQGSVGVASGACPLYRYQTATGGASGKLSYIASATSSVYGNVSTGDVLTPEPRFTKAYVTPDGRYLLFQNSGGIYRYDGLTESLVQVSPSGEFTRSASRQLSSGPVRALSDNGQYAFFDSTQSLVPQATNGTLDVYEWHDGRISLIGSGADPAPSFFLGYSPNPGAHTEEAREAGNVFIGTHAQLVRQDTNSLGDIYDARACEPDSPCIRPEAQETAQCEGSSCQIPPPPPSDRTPASQTFSGPGNLTPQAPPPPPKPPTAAQVRAKKLAAALKQCRKKANRHKRLACEKQARKRYSSKSSKGRK